MMNNDSKVLLDSLLETASNKWKVDGKPMDINLIIENMNKIAFHESKYGTDKYQPKQTGGGDRPGMGIFQFEKNRPGKYDKYGREYINQGAQTAINRLIAQNQGVAPSFLEGIAESNYDVSSLSPVQQQAIFLGNLLQMPDKGEGYMPASFMGVDTDKELAEYWAQYHQAGTKPETDEYNEMINKFLRDMPYYGG